ncbi:MAG: tyrosine-type recombinase/integrase [Chitinispirillaceae bacterium]|nr:tyrosine-type recombinase/integrase [Chitinispirillaceae bacterium]
MALIKIGPNKWRIIVSVRVYGIAEPAKKRETFFGTKTEAEARQAEIIKDLRNPRSLTPRHVKHFSEAVEVFREKRGPFSPSHDNKVAFLKEETGHIILEEYPDCFEAYLRVLKRTPTRRHRQRSAASINRYIEIVKAVFGLLVELEIIEKNPITKTRFPKGEEKARDRYLTEEERLRLINTIREHRPYILPFIEYSIAVPCRKTELVTARREQYNPFTNTIYIPDSKADIPINKPVPVPMVDYFRSIPPDCPYLFYRQDEDGKYHPLGTLQKPWAFCLKKAGLANVRIHDLRHVAASDLYAAGVPEREIMDIAGWKTPMLSTYRHRDSLKSAQKINTLFRKGDSPTFFSSAVNQ